MSGMNGMGGMVLTWVSDCRGIACELPKYCLGILWILSGYSLDTLWGCSWSRGAPEYSCRGRRKFVDSI
jgi:hypothetical protein